MAKKNIYIYPLSSKDDRLGLFNPYIDDLIASLAKDFNFVNLNKPSRTGIVDIFKYQFRLHYIHFNWIEKIHTNRFGNLQYRILFLMIPFLKQLGIRIIWTMHNKLSHEGAEDHKTLAIFKLMLKQSDLILTHASSGIAFGEKLVPGSGKKIIYLPHPVKDRRLEKQDKKIYDVLIWGTISPYKGIDKFLESLYQHNVENQFRILIVGKASDPEYFEKLKTYENSRIEIRNEFINDDDLAEMISLSKTVLFTYSKASILSSGVLMDSLGYGANIVGPDVGAFSDLAKDQIIRTYANLPQALEVLREECEKPGSANTSRLDQFLIENSWPEFGKRFGTLIRTKT